MLLHMLRDQNTEEFALRTVLHTIKSVSAHQVNRALARSGPLWEEESFDHVLRSHEHLKAKIEYVAMNPVRRGLVRSPGQYRWLWINRNDVA